MEMKVETVLTKFLIAILRKIKGVCFCVKSDLPSQFCPVNPDEQTQV